MPTIWIVNHYAGGPGLGTGWRHWELARRWITSGVNCRIFAASTSVGGATHASRHGVREVEGVPMEFVDVRPYAGNGFSRLRNIVAFNRALPSHLRRAVHRTGHCPDVVLASSPQPLVWPAAARAAREFGAAFVPEIRDIWPETLVQIGGISRWHPLVGWCNHVTRHAIRGARMVFSPLAHVSEYLDDIGWPHPECVHVANGADVAAPMSDHASSSDVARLEALRESGKRLLLYAGALGVPNAMDQLLDAVKGLSIAGRSRLACVIIGDGTERERLAARASREGISSIEFWGFRPQLQARSLLSRFDAGYLGWLDRPLYRYGIAPQKLSFMLAAGLPVIHATSAPADIVAAHHLGWTCPAEHPARLTEQLARFLAASDSELSALSARCTAHAREALDWDRVASRALETLHPLLRNG